MFSTAGFRIWNKINSTKFQSYALGTAEDLIKKYPWYYLPVSEHKVLIWGYIGKLSEKAAESLSKNLLLRSENTREIARILMNADFLHRLLLF